MDRRSARRTGKGRDRMCVHRGENPEEDLGRILEERWTRDRLGGPGKGETGCVCVIEKTQKKMHGKDLGLEKKMLACLDCYPVVEKLEAG